MASATFLRIFLIQVFLFEGGYFSNSSTPTHPTGIQLNTTLVLREAETELTTANPYDQSKVTKILFPNSSTESKETTVEQLETNSTLAVKAIGSSDLAPVFRLPNSAAVGAGVFVISAVVGYISCLGYRRFLQRKYGNSQILVAEEVYDTSDLRNFEI